MHRPALSTFALVALLSLGLVGAAQAVQAAKPKKKVRATAVHADDAPDVVTYGARDDVMRYADEVAERRGLDAAWLKAMLAQSRFQPSVVRYIMPPPAGVPKNWAAYRARFVEPRRIRAGVAFWQANERWLRLAEERYGVPAEIVVGIVGVETLYGQQMGNFRIVDALATLAFDFPKERKDRSAFFRDELENYFVLCQAQRLDPLAPKGSYAGAIGLPQFMPSSINKYAIDFDEDGQVDLQRSTADAIGSVAHYLAEFGWQRGLAPYFEIAEPSDTQNRATLLVPDILPSFSPQEMVTLGAHLGADALAAGGKLALVELQNGGAAPSYVAGSANFYAITRYNWSSYYAMAVIHLGTAVAAARTASN